MRACNSDQGRRTMTAFDPIAHTHMQYPKVDGLFWMSRQRHSDQALLLFGHRVGTARKGKRMGGPLRTDDALRQAVLAPALRVGIDAN